MTVLLLLNSDANAFKVRTLHLLVRSLLGHRGRIRSEYQTLLARLGPLLPLRGARDTVGIWVQGAVVEGEKSALCSFITPPPQRSRPAVGRNIITTYRIKLVQYPCTTGTIAALLPPGTYEAGQPPLTLAQPKMALTSTVCGTPRPWAA